LNEFIGNTGTVVIIEPDVGKPISPDLLLASSFKVILTSPDTDRYRPLEKNALPGRKFYMPLWEKEEVYAAKKVLGINLSRSVLDERMSLWGGVARSIFSSTDVPLGEASMRTIVGSLSDEAVKLALRWDLDAAFSLSEGKFSWRGKLLHS